jgi:hypothetical protein
MPGSWELTPQVLCAVLHTEHVSMSWAINFRSLQIPGPVIAPTGMPYDDARNLACMRALEMGVRWIFFLDSDVTPPADAVPRLIARRKAIVSGVYHRRSPPVGVPVMQKPPGRWVTAYPPNALIEVDVVGAGCLLVETDLLRRLPPQRPGHHWFDWRCNLRGVPGEDQSMCQSEDFTFNLHASRKMGIRTFVSTDVVCGHLGMASACYGGMQSIVPA